MKVADRRDRTRNLIHILTTLRTMGFTFPEVSPGMVRLSGGQDHFGNVEIWKHGEWGVICDENWDLEDAYVVCRQLGYVGAWQALKGAAFGPGQGRIWLSNLQCNGSERNLLDCPESTYLHCSHSQVAAVVCNRKSENPTIGHCMI